MRARERSSSEAHADVRGISGASPRAECGALGSRTGLCALPCPLARSAHTPTPLQKEEQPAPFSLAPDLTPGPRELAQSWWTAQQLEARIRPGRLVYFSPWEMGPKAERGGYPLLHVRSRNPNTINARRPNTAIANTIATFCCCMSEEQIPKDGQLLSPQTSKLQWKMGQ